MNKQDQLLKIIHTYPGIRGYVLDKMLKEWSIGSVYAALSNLRKLGRIIAVKDGETFRYYEVE